MKALSFFIFLLLQISYSSDNNNNKPTPPFFLKTNIKSGKEYRKKLASKIAKEFNDDDDDLKAEVERLNKEYLDTSVLLMLIKEQVENQK